MNTKQLNTLSKKLYSKIPFIGKYQQQKAAQALANNASPAALQILAQALTTTKNKTVHHIALTALQQATNPQTINFICQIWADSRNQHLATLIKNKHWIATHPPQIHILSALLNGSIQTILPLTTATLPILLNARQDKNTHIIEQAKKALNTPHPDKAVQQALCQLIIENEDTFIQQLVINHQYAPTTNPHQQALFYFLTEQWTHYETLDFNHTLLKTTYQQSPLALQQRLIEKIKKTGYTTLINLIIINKQKQIQNPTLNQEWETALSLLTQQKQWPQLWHLATRAPVKWSKAFLLKLQAANWTPNNSQEQTAFKALLKLAHQSPGHNPSLRALTQTQTTLNKHTRKVNCLALSGDGQLLVSGSNDHTIQLWQLPQGKHLSTLEDTGKVGSIAITPNGQILAYARGWYSEIELLWLPEGSHLATLTEHKNSIEALAISPNGQTLASSAMDNTIKLWQLPEGELLTTIKSPRDWIDYLVFSPDSKTLIGAGRDKIIRIWSVPDGKLLTTLTKHNDSIKSLAISPDGKLLASASTWPEHVINIWELPQGTHKKTLDDHTDAIESLIISPDGQLLISASNDKSIRLWKLPECTPLTTLQGHEKAVKALSITPDGQLLISASDDHSIKLWTLQAIRLSYLAMEHTRPTDITWAQQTLSNPNLSKSERTWLKFTLALMHWQKRFDVDIEETSLESIFGAFEIELDPE